MSKINDHNNMIKHMTRPSKSPDPKTVELDMTKHIVDTLNENEDANIILEDVIRNSPTPVKGYVGGATPDSTVPTKAERIAAQKQFEKLAVQADSRGVFQKAVAADEAAYKKSQQYPDRASPEQMAVAAYNFEKYKQMTSSDVKKDKAIIKKKKLAPVTSYPKINFTNYQALTPIKLTPMQLQQEQDFKKVLQEHEAEQIKQKYAGIAGLLGGKI